MPFLIKFVNDIIGGGLGVLFGVWYAKRQARKEQVKFPLSTLDLIAVQRIPLDLESLEQDLRHRMLAFVHGIHPLNILG